MVVFFGEGQLGNQIFQYAFLKTIAKPTELIVSDNAKQLIQLFDGIEHLICLRKKIAHKLKLSRIFHYLSVLKIISSYKPVELAGGYGEANDKLEKRKGFLPITYVYPGFFQSEKSFKQECIQHLSIKKHYVAKAEEYLNSLPHKKKLFVHVRRGDYINFTILGKSALLPLAYYKRSIMTILEKNKDLSIIFLTDDADFVEVNFTDYPCAYISKHSLFVDFAIMSKCENGVMSNSSFSWWASYFMGHRENLICPSYWLGYHSQIEFPNLVTPSFATLVIE